MTREHDLPASPLVPATLNDEPGTPAADVNGQR